MKSGAAFSGPLLKTFDHSLQARKVNLTWVEREAIDVIALEKGAHIG